VDVATAALLLGVASGFDNRKPNQDAAAAWAEALGELDPTMCRDAIVDHYTRSREWLMPADVIQAVRRKMAELAPVTAEVPAELQAMDDGPEFDAAYRRWMQTGEIPDPQKQLTA
jgi:Asp-tRNA(Asn)/Glu-tRNA(Gln) amidotransferase A subunit family amidase